MSTLVMQQVEGPAWDLIPNVSGNTCEAFRGSMLGLG